MARLSIGRLGFFWWGTFLRGWLQWGRGATIVTDKNYSVHTLWTFYVGPIQIEWWNDPDWRSFNFTPEEAAAEDERDRLMFEYGRHPGD